MIPLRDDNPAGLTPVLTWALIGLCTAVFIWQSLLTEADAERAVLALGAIPAVVLGQAELAPDLVWVPSWATLLTSMFMHGGLFHLLGNMLYLWIFGNNVEDAMGHGRFLIFYRVCGLAGAAAHVWSDPGSAIPMVGASGAISGVLGAYLLLYPHARVLVGVPIGFYGHTLYLPAVAVLGFWLVLQILNAVLTSPEGGGVAWLAHMGGFIAGMALVPLFKRRGVPLWRPALRR